MQKPTFQHDGKFVEIQDFLPDTTINNQYNIYSDDMTGQIIVENLKDNNKGWTLSEPNVSFSPMGTTNDNKYMIVNCQGMRASFMGKRIIDMSSGICVYKVTSSESTNAYYNEQTGEIVIEEENEDEQPIYHCFYSFDRLLKLCHEATEGMSLSERARRQFYLQ